MLRQDEPLPVVETWERKMVQLVQYPDQSRGELISDGSEQQRLAAIKKVVLQIKLFFWQPKSLLNPRIPPTISFIFNWVFHAYLLAICDWLWSPELTGEPAGVDVVRSVVLVAGAEEDSVAVSRQEVRWPVLTLVADLQSGAVLSLTRVIGANKLENRCLFRCDAK